MMTNKLAVNLGAVQETLLIPLYGRYQVSKKLPDVFYDKKAVEIVPKLDYPFARWDKALGSLMGSVLRTQIYDDYVKTFMLENPQGTIIEMGCGLNTRFERLDNGSIHWLEGDLPDVLTLRQQFFQEKHSSRYQCIEMDLTQPANLISQVKKLPKPWCFVSEAVVIYLEKPQVEALLAAISSAVTESGKQGMLVMDTAATIMVQNQHKHDAMKLMPRNSWFKWACDEPKDVENLGGFTLMASKNFADIPPESYKHFSKKMYFALKYFRFLFKKRLAWYALNQYRILG